MKPRARRILIRRGILPKVSERGLRALLEDFTPYLEKRHVKFDQDVRNVHAWHRICDALRYDAPDTPPELRERLAWVASLGPRDGAEYLRQLVRERGLEGPDVAESGYAFAARMAKEQPEICRQAHARVEASTVTRAWEYHVPPGALLTIADALAKRELLAEKLEAWAIGRDRRPYREVDVFQNGSRLVMNFAHADATTSHAVVTPELQRKYETFTPARSAQVVIDAESRRMYVSTRYPAEADQFRRIVGEVFHGNANHYVSHGVVSLAPLLETNGAALDVGGRQYITAIRLAEVHTVDDDEFSSEFRAPVHENLLRRLARIREGGTPTYLRLFLSIRTSRLDRYSAEVCLRPPNKIDCNRDDPEVEAIVHEFLIDAGFETPPRTHPGPAFAASAE